MARKKNSSALFEVISKGKEDEGGRGFTVPTWMGGAEQAPPPAEPIGGQEPARQAPRPARPAAPAHNEPMVSTGSGRLRLSVSPVIAGAAGAGLLLLLAVAFWIGRATAPGGGPGDSEVEAGAGGPKAMPKDGGSDAPERIKGKYYLVIETLKGVAPEDKREAERIVKFCREHGEPAEIRKDRIDGEWRYVIWSYTPFDSPTDYQAIQHARTIEEMGRRYPGPYRFQQRRSPTAPLDPRYERAR